jgi:hypothetical protein
MYLNAEGSSRFEKDFTRCTFLSQALQATCRTMVLTVKHDLNPGRHLLEKMNFVFLHLSWYNE